MRRRSLVLLVLCAATTCLVGGLAPTASAQTALYRYVDARGVVHFTNAPTDRRYQPLPSQRLRRVSYPARSARRSDYDPLIEHAALRHGVPAALIKAVIATESSFDARAVSPKGAMGLMQLMPETAQDLGVREPFQAEQNVHAGTRYLRSLHDQFGSWTHTLAAYNAGPNAVERYRGVPPYPETLQYVKRVLSYYRRFHDDFSR